MYIVEHAGNFRGMLFSPPRKHRRGQGRMKRKGHATYNVYCVVVKLLMSQQDTLYLANRPHVNRCDSGREHCYTGNLPRN